MRRVRSLVFLILVTITIDGCQILPVQPSHPQLITVEAPRPIEIVRAVGHGTVKTDAGYTETQMKLFAQRASRVDAYRNLSEIVYGIHISGTATVSDMILKNDTVQSYVSGYLKGAREISSEKLSMENGAVTYETILEMPIDQSFLNDLQTFPIPLATPERSKDCCRYEDKHYYISY